jgi:hypothetical protein
MSRSLGWSFLLSAAAVVVSACGARTGDDELLGSDGSLGVGGHDVVGGTSSGGGTGSGGDPGVGGWVATGATTGTGGLIGTGGWSTGGAIGVGGWIGTGAWSGAGGAIGTGGWIGSGGFGAGGIGVGGFGGLPNDCCSVANTPGCFNPFVTSCVCAKDSFCCNTAWDGWCVEEVETLGCGTCDPGTGGVGGIGGTGGISTGGVAGSGGFGATGGTGGSTGSCCGTHSTAGCVDPAVEACVCGADPYCCTDSWDGICVTEVTSLGCGMCGGGTGGIGGSGGVGGIGGTGGISTGGFGGVGGSIGGSGGMGTGGVGQCQVVFPDECGSCLCGDCYSNMQGCFADPQCWAVLSCLDSPDVCQAVIDLVGGWNAPSVVKALQLLSCAGNSGCPCN